MLIFQKPFNAHADVWYETFLEHWLFMYITVLLGLIPVWGKRALPRIMLRY